MILNSNFIEHAGAMEIAAAVQHSPYTHVDLCGNVDIDAAGFDALDAAAVAASKARGVDVVVTHDQTLLHRTKVRR